MPLGPITFMAPLALLGLLALPVIWWLLRAAPPTPKRVSFPPLALLAGLDPSENTPVHTPWWIMVLRLALVSLAIVAIAQPVMFARQQGERSGPLVIVMDDGWSAAPNWGTMRRDAIAALETAARADRTAAIVFTAPQDGPQNDIRLDDPLTLIPQLLAKTPSPWEPDPAGTATRIRQAAATGGLAQDARRAPAGRAAAPQANTASPDDTNLETTDMDNPGLDNPDLDNPGREGTNQQAPSPQTTSAQTTSRESTSLENTAQQNTSQEITGSTDAGTDDNANTESGPSGPSSHGLTFLWFTDRVDRPGVETLSQTLDDLGRVRVQGPSPSQMPVLVLPPDMHPRGFSVPLVRAHGAGTAAGDGAGAILALDSEGRTLARTPFAFVPGETRTTTVAELPLEIRNRLAMLRLENRASAGGAQVLDDAWRQPLVGLISTTRADDRQPLLSELHYIEQALVGRAAMVKGTVEDLLARQPAVMVLTDTAVPTASGLAALGEYVDDGGMLIRFAGPRMADAPDALIPVKLRSGGRALGGALAWDEPQTLDQFGTDSPFFDLVAPPDATVTQQVLAEPTPDLAQKVWVRLADGTPLVTAAPRGDGRLILFHVTASPDWSTLPLSGLFSQMLARTLSYAKAASGPGEAMANQTGRWTLNVKLTATGRMTPVDGGVTLPSDAIATGVTSPTAPPGIYARGAARAARNVAGADTTLAALATMPNGLPIAQRLDPGPRRIAGLLFVLVLIGLAVDGAVMAAMAGRLSRPQWLFATPRWRSPGRARSPAPVMLALALASAPVSALVLTAGLGALATPSRLYAQDVSALPQAVDTVDETAALAALDQLRLAYVVTGNDRVDTMSEAGLHGLSQQLIRRTSINAGAPLAVDLAQDELGLLPLVYWPVQDGTPAPSAAIAAKLDRFIKSGGVLILDTQTGSSGVTNQPHPGLTAIGSALDIPPLMRLPADPQGHVLNRSFYLLDDLPGRWANTPVWLEADQRGSARDGVSGVIIGSADWSAAWAVDDTGMPLAVIAADDPSQREYAYRAGVNLVMYVLTGNYKADQVHVAKILERLGQ